MSDSQSRSACTPAIAQLACIIFWQNFNSSFFMSHRAAPFKSQLINAILPYLTHNIVAPALPSCQCHRQMPLHNQRCRDQSSYGLASTIQHFILSSLPLFTQFHSVYNSEILCCQCHLSNTVSLHHCLFIPDPFSCSKFFNTATWCLPYCRSESNSAMFILHPPASLFPPLPALIMGNSLICWFH